METHKLIVSFGAKVSSVESSHWSLCRPPDPLLCLQSEAGGHLTSGGGDARAPKMPLQGEAGADLKQSSRPNNSFGGEILERTVCPALMGFQPYIAGNRNARTFLAYLLFHLFSSIDLVSLFLNSDFNWLGQFS